VNVLERILQDKRNEIQARSASVPVEVLRAQALEALPPRSLAGALSPGGRRGGSGFRIIAEVKKASPSKGLIRPDFDPVAIARAYERAGAAAISVLTDEKHFQGKLSYLEDIRRETSLPLLRKDFILDSYQVWESRAAGADAILLIAQAFPDGAGMARLAREAAHLGMDVLWEVHDRGDLERVLPLGPRILGINNRSLRDFEVTLETTRALLPDIPAGVIIVSESGFSCREDLEMLSGWGVHAFLIGEHLMRQEDPGAALARLLGSDSRSER
jgi:indole-3-glycerol phosphate synthase